MKTSNRLQWGLLILGVALLGGCPQAAIQIPVAFQLGAGNVDLREKNPLTLHLLEIILAGLSGALPQLGDRP